MAINGLCWNLLVFFPSLGRPAMVPREILGQRLVT